MCLLLDSYLKNVAIDALLAIDHFDMKKKKNNMAFFYTISKQLLTMF